MLNSILRAFPKPGRHARGGPLTRMSRRRAALTAYGFLAPGLLLFPVFRIYPLVEGLRITFTNARLGRPTRASIGLDQLRPPARRHPLPGEPGNTGFYTVTSTLPILAVPLAAGRRAEPRRRAADAAARRLLLPVHALGRDGRPRPGSGCSTRWSGPFNYYLRRSACPPARGSPTRSTAMWAIVVTDRWWVTGYYLVIYLAGLQDIPRDLYEAAAIDGATRWRSFWAITLPLLRPVLLFVVGDPRDRLVPDLRPGLRADRRRPGRRDAHRRPAPLRDRLQEPLPASAPPPRWRGCSS